MDHTDDSGPEVQVVDSGHRDIQQLIDEFHLYNERRGGIYGKQQLNLVAREPGGIAIGIAKGYSLWEWFYLERLFVREASRRKGVGKLLLHAAEREAKLLGCRAIHLDTFSFQALDFYLRHGYRIFGQLKNYPSEHIRYSLFREL